MVIEIQENSEQYDIIRFPGGELDVRLMGDTIQQLKKIANGPWEVDIVARIRSSEDIIILGLLNNAIHGVDERLHVHCWIPYLPYARADRRFTPGDCFGLEFFGSIINSMDFDSVITLDVHSDAARANIKRLTLVSPAHYIKKAIADFASKYLNGNQPLTILFPDKGAADRYNVPSRVEDIKIEAMYATKNRDEATGRLSGFTVPVITGPTLIVDDICDGGGTFLGIAKEANTRYPLGLYVTHGIFSNGLDALQQFFKDIYCTDSYKKVYGQSSNITQFKIKIPD